MRGWALVVVIGCGARSELDVPSALDASVDVEHDHLVLDAAVDVHGDAPVDATPDVPIVPDAGAPIPAISSSNFACAVNAAGVVKCWQKYAQAAIVPLPTVVEVTVGSGHAFARTQTDSVWVWGTGQNCDLGDGKTGVESITKPQPVTTLGHSVQSIRTAGEQTLALRTDGTVVAFGEGPNGTGVNKSLCTPTPVVGLLGAVSKIAQGAGNACALLTDHRVQCWGENFFGTSGTGNENEEDTADSPVSNLVDAIDVAVSYTHACAVRSAGGIVCWGDDTVGELGDGQTNTSSAVPVDVAGLAGPAVAVTVNVNDTCAQLASGAVQCWGENESGSLGNGGSPAVVLTPTTIIANDVISLDEAQDLGCVLLSSGAAQCWGFWDPNDDAGSPSPVGVQGMP